MTQSSSPGGNRGSVREVWEVVKRSTISRGCWTNLVVYSPLPSPPFPLSPGVRLRFIFFAFPFPPSSFAPRCRGVFHKRGDAEPARRSARTLDVRRRRHLPGRPQRGQRSKGA